MLWLDASEMVSGAQWLQNKGTGGRALDARVGSVGSAQIINGALKLPRIGANSATTPDSAALDITGDLEIVVRVACLDWAITGAQQVFVAKAGTTSERQYAFYLEQTGELTFVASSSTTTWTTTHTSTGATVLVDGTAYWIKVAFDSDDGAGNSVSTFSYAADQASEPSSWTTIGSPVSTAGTTTIANDGGVLRIGETFSNAAPFGGSIFRVIVRNGIAGTTVFDADFTAQTTLATSFTESSSNAATVTINSTTGVDTNDPLLLPHTGTNYLYLPGAASNWATTPDLAASRPSGTVDVIAQLQLPDWTPSSVAYVINQGGYTSQQRLRFFVNTNGKLGALIYTEAGVSFTAASTVATGFTDGDLRWVRLLVEPGSPDGTCKFYTSTDGSSWTQLGTTVTATGITDLRVSVGGATTGIGSITSTVGLTIGNFYRVQLWSGDSTSGGTKVFDADFTTNTGQSTFTESSSNAATVTINRATSGRKAVMVVRPTLLFGTDDYLEVADNALLNFALADDRTVVAVIREHATPIDNGQIVSKRDGGGAGAAWALQTTSAGAVRLFQGDAGASQNIDTPSVTNGTRSLVASVRNRTADNVTNYVNGVAGTPATDTLTGTSSNANPLRIGRAATGPTLYFDGEIEHVAVFRSALDATQLGQIATYLGV